MISPKSPSALPYSITLTRHGAAIRQIVWAIEMMRMGFYDCAVTLAGAAEGMAREKPEGLYRTIVDAGIPDELAVTEYAMLDEKQRKRFWNIQRDWLKHGGPTHAPEMTVKRNDVELMIARAITKLDLNENNIPPAALPSLLWFYKTYSQMTEDELAAAIEVERSKGS